MFEDLSILGCLPNKSHLKHLEIPILQPTLISHFIRGFYDGDGICYKDGRIGFCGHYDILNFIYNHLNTILDKPTNVHLTYNSKNNIYYLTYNVENEIQQIVQYIYKDLSNQPFLKRKYETYRPLL